jgi:hypothetical protein
MLSKPLAIALVVTGCVTAAAGGAYVAVRQNDAAALSASQAPAAVHREPLLTAVEATEAMVEPLQAATEPRRLEPAAPPPAAPRAATAAGPAPRPAPAPARTPAVSPRTGAPDRPEVSRPAPPPVEPPAVPVEPLRVPEAQTIASVRPEPPLPPLRVFEDLVVPASSVVGLQIETPVSSERARLEDRVEARVLRDVIVDGRTAIPTGSRALGVVTQVERGGKMKERAQLGVRFHTLVLADGTTLPMRTDTIHREGDSPGAESARKIGGAAAGGAILGAIIGGRKGAAVGGATGAAGGTAVVMAGDRNPATLPVGAIVTVRLSEPLVVEVERR